MLEGKYYDAVDMVAPFLGTYIDLCFVLIDSAPVTNSFTKYVYMCDLIF